MRGIGTLKLEVQELDRGKILSSGIATLALCEEGGQVDAAERGR